jgi:hypothetical protein
MMISLSTLFHYFTILSTETTINSFLSSIHHTVSTHIHTIIHYFINTLFQPLLILLDQPLNPSDPTSLTIRESFIRSLGYSYFAYFPTHLIQLYTPRWLKQLINRVSDYSASLNSTIPCYYVEERNCKGYWFSSRGRGSAAEKQGVKSINEQTKIVLYVLYDPISISLYLCVSLCVSIDLTITGVLRDQTMCKRN